MRISHRVLFGVLALAYLASCGGSKRRNNDDDDAGVRQGEDLIAEDLKYYDAKADISADATKITFISGRDNVQRVYTVNMSGDKKPKRLTSTSEKTTRELEQSLSPDGKWVLFAAADSKGLNLYSRDFSGTKTTLALTDKAHVVSEISISSDSSLFAFTSRDYSGIASKVYVGKIDATNGPDVNSIIAVNADDTDESAPAWIAGSASLILTRRDISTYNDKLIKRDITIGGTLSASDATDVAALSDMAIITNSAYTASGTDVFFVASNLDQKIAPISAQGVFNYPNKLAVDSRAKTLKISNASLSTLPSLGLGDSNVSVATSGVGAWISKTAVSCQQDKLTYQSVLSFYQPSAAKKVVMLRTKLLEKDKLPQTTQSACLSEDDTKNKYKIDLNLNAAKINANATATDFSIVYVSFSFADNEVWLYKRVADQDSIERVSNNLAN